VTVSLAGVFPIVPTIFRPDGALDLDEQRGVVDWMVASGSDGLVFPGVASEFDQLSESERTELAAVVAAANAGRRTLVIGVSSPDAAQSLRYVAQARLLGASAVMAMNPASLRDDRAAVAAWYRDVASAGMDVILQNAPPPLGSALPVEFLAELVAGIPGVTYVKEEALPCGQRITHLLALRPPGLQGVFGGAGGRYITDELARGAVGTMPASELVDLHALLFAAHRRGDRAGVRGIFNRMLPLLNMQAVFRMRLTKEVLARRGVITQTHVRAPNPDMDAGDFSELDEMLAELADILDPKRP
jgi:dihydrodipicolinate synthase/N-acetylneuraminate lyase